MKSKPAQTGVNLPLALFFAIFVIGIIISSFIWKGIALLQKSTFDSMHQYILLIKDGNVAKITIFNPDTQSINQVSLAGKYQSNEIGKSLEVPIDTNVQTNAINKQSSYLMFGLLFSKTSQLPIADRLKLWLFARSVKDSDIQNSELQLPITGSENNSIEQLFTDRTIYQEAKTITVINATGVNGLGSRFGKLLTNIGANVIMVTSGDFAKKSSIKYIGQTSYTLSRISKILDTTPQIIKSKTAISDITVIIGEDKSNTNQF